MGVNKTTATRGVCSGKRKVNLLSTPGHHTHTFKERSTGALTFNFASEIYLRPGRFFKKTVISKDLCVAKDGVLKSVLMVESSFL